MRKTDLDAIVEKNGIRFGNRSRWRLINTQGEAMGGDGLKIWEKR